MPELHVGRPELMKVLRVKSPQRIQAFIADGMPFLIEGKRGSPWVFDLEACVQWWGGRLARDAGGEKIDAPREKALKDRADRELKEIELALRRGEVAPVADLETAAAAAASTARARLLGVPAKVAAELAEATEPARCHGIVETALYEALEAIAAYTPEDVERPE